MASESALEFVKYALDRYETDDPYMGIRWDALMDELATSEDDSEDENGDNL